MEKERESEDWEIISLGPATPGWHALFTCTMIDQEIVLDVSPVICWGVCRCCDVWSDPKTCKETGRGPWHRTAQPLIVVEDELFPFGGLGIYNCHRQVGLAPPGINAAVVWGMIYPDAPMPPLAPWRLRPNPPLPCATCKHWGPEEHEKGRECRHRRMGTEGCGSRYRRPDDFCSGWEKR